MHSPPPIKEAPESKDHNREIAFMRRFSAFGPRSVPLAFFLYPHDPRHGVTIPFSSSFHNFDLLAVTLAGSRLRTSPPAENSAKTGNLLLVSEQIICAGCFGEQENYAYTGIFCCALRRHYLGLFLIQFKICVATRGRRNGNHCL